MSKNLTRKGFALGTVVALGASLFAGTPANAAPTALYLDTAFGTSGASQTGVLGQYFTLAASALGRATADEVEFYVEGVAAANVEATARVVTDLTASGAYGLTPAETSVSADLKQTSYSSGTSSWTAGSYYQFAIKVDSTNVTATTSVKVTPFLDSVVNDGKPGANELVGSAVTINFVKASELTATPTLSAPAGAVASATVAVSGGVNLAQFRANATGGHGATPFKVLFSETGTAWGSDIDALWDSVDSVLYAESVGTTTAALIYGAKGRLVVSSSSTVDSAAATAVTATAGEVASIGTITGVKGPNFRADEIDNAFPYTTNNVVRAGSGSFKATSTITAENGKSLAGQKVTYTITEASVNSLPVGATITAVGGKTLTVASSTVTESITREVTTDSSGKAVLELSYTGITDGKTFNISAKATSATGPSTGGTAVTFTGQDSYAVAISDGVEDTNSSAVRHIAKAGSYSLALTVVDQFGQTPTGTFRLVTTSTGNPAFTSPTAVSGGKATLTGTDNTTASTATYDVTATLQKLGSDGTTYAAIGRAVAQTYAISVGTVSAASTISFAVANTASATRAGKTLLAGNDVADQQSVPRETPAGNATINSTVTSSTGTTVAGAAVTYTGTGVLFKAGNVWGLGSLTVYTGANGTTGAVELFSNNTGKQTITVTSGSATKTQLVTWAAVTTGGSAWTVTAPTSILPGQTLKVSAVLKDKYGAAVDTSGDLVKVSYTGPGFVTATPAKDTDEDGVISFTVLLGSGDSGTATVKLTYANTNGFDEVTLNDDVVSTTSIIIGAAPVAASATTAAIAGSTKRMFVSVTGNSAAKNVVVKVAGRTVATLKGSAAKKTYTIRATKGSKKVTVFVGGKLIATKTVTVK